MFSQLVQQANTEGNTQFDFNLNAHIPFLYVVMHPSAWPFFLFVESYLLLSRIFSRPQIPTGYLQIPLFKSFSPLSLWILSFACTCLVIDKTYTLYLEVCVCSDFEAARTCQSVFWWKWDLFPQTGLPFKNLLFCVSHDRTENRPELLCYNHSPLMFLTWLSSPLYQ